MDPENRQRDRQGNRQRGAVLFTRSTAARALGVGIAVSLLAVAWSGAVQFGIDGGEAPDCGPQCRQTLADAVHATREGLPSMVHLPPVVRWPRQPGPMLDERPWPSCSAPGGLSVHHFDEAKRIARAELDCNGDGQMDRWLYFDGEDQPVRMEYDTDFDGIVDVRREAFPGDAQASLAPAPAMAPEAAPARSLR